MKMEEEYSPLDKPLFVEGKVDWRGKPARRDKHGGIYASAMILGAFAFEGLVVISLSSNLVTYFNREMHFGIADAANQMTSFMGTNYMLSIGVAVLADAYIGRFASILVGGVIEFLGLGLLGLQARVPSLRPPVCNIHDLNSHCVQVRGANAVLLFTALYMVALGSGGVKAASPSHGADQFDEKDPREARQKSSYFNWMLVFATMGNLVGVTVVIWIQYHIGWDWAFGVCTLSMLVAIAMLVVGLPTYRIHVVNGSSVLIEIAQVFVAAFRNRKLKLPEECNDLYEADKNTQGANRVEYLPHTDAYRFLDKAAIQTSSPQPKKLCRVTQVENVKILLNMMPVFACTVIMTLCLAQLQTFSVQQANTMDLTIANNFQIPPASLPVIPFTSLLIIAPIYDRLLVPYAGKFTGIPTGITYLQRVGCGLFLAAASMAAAAIVEVKRKRIAIDNAMVDANPKEHPLPISVFWLSFQFFIFGIADLFTYVGLMEFFYSQVPNDIKAISSCFLWISMALGYFLSTIVVKTVNLTTKNFSKSGGWVAGNNINRNRLDLFYWLLSILSLINFCIYIFVAKRYKYRKVISVSEGEEEEQLHTAEP